MKPSEKAAKEQLAKKHGRVTHKSGIEAGNVHEGESPTTVLKHGPIARLLGKPPKRG